MDDYMQVAGHVMKDYVGPVIILLLLVVMVAGLAFRWKE